MNAEKNPPTPRPIFLAATINFCMQDKTENNHAFVLQPHTVSFHLMAPMVKDLFGLV